MKKQIQVFVCLRRHTKYDYSTYPCASTVAWEPEAWSFRPTDDEHLVFVGEQTVEVQVPDNFDPVPQQTAALEAQKQEALDDYMAKVSLINERLSKLQALEFTS
jgi:hypothetical protein